MEQLHIKNAASSEFGHDNLYSDNPKIFLWKSHLSRYETLFCKHLSRPENVAIQSPGLIQNCKKKLEGCSKTVIVLLCKYQSAAQKKLLA